MFGSKPRGMTTTEFEDATGANPQRKAARELRRSRRRANKGKQKPRRKR